MSLTATTFDRIIILRKDEAELFSNLASPDRANPFGKTTKQRAGFMKWQHYLIEKAQDSPVTYIEGNETKNTYAEIMKLLGQNI